VIKHLVGYGVSMFNSGMSRLAVGEVKQGWPPGAFQQTLRKEIRKPFGKWCGNSSAV